MFGSFRPPRPVALLATGPLLVGLLATVPSAAASPAPTARSSTWTVRWASQPRADASPRSGESVTPAISGNGAVVAFASTSHLGGHGGPLPALSQRMFVTPVTSSTPARLAVGPEGQLGNGSDSGCWGCRTLSSDGQTSVFVSSSDNLTPGDTNHTSDVFLRNLTTGAVTLVSHGPAGVPADSYSNHPQISADGRWVLFTSWARNLVSQLTLPGGTYLYDALTDTARQLVTPSDGFDSLMSGDGTTVVMTSSFRLVPADRDDRRDTYRLDLATGEYSLVDVSTSGTRLRGLTTAGMSDDGSTVAFVYERGTAASRVAVRDLTTGQTTVVPGSAGVLEARLSGDGRRLVMKLPGTTGGRTTLTTAVTDLTGAVLYRSGPEDTEGPVTISTSISTDGTCIAFATPHAELAQDLNGLSDVYTACEG